MELPAWMGDNGSEEVFIMKKLIWGCALMLSGIIGAVGWMLARIMLVQDGAWSTVLRIFDFTEPECYIIILFYMIALAGAVIAVRALKEKKE